MIYNIDINYKALNSKTAKTFAQYQKISNAINQIYFSQLPSWTWINNKEIKISSTEIRLQRKLLRE